MGDPKVQIYQDEEAGWRFRVVAGNGEIIAQGESHTTEADALRAARTVATDIAVALDIGAIEREG